MSDTATKETLDVQGWFAEQKADAIRQLDCGYVPLMWIHANDIQQALSDKDRPEMTDEEAEQFLAEHFDKIEDSFAGDMDAFWYAISEAIGDTDEEDGE